MPTLLCITRAETKQHHETKQCHHQCLFDQWSYFSVHCTAAADHGSPGLGKTITVLSLILRTKGKLPALSAPKQCYAEMVTLLDSEARDAHVIWQGWDGRDRFTHMMQIMRKLLPIAETTGKVVYDVKRGRSSGYLGLWIDEKVLTEQLDMHDYADFMPHTPPMNLANIAKYARYELFHFLVRHMTTPCCY